jgi:enamine deaminase RidA (YjgF/YER057c/UK114 family)
VYLSGQVARTADGGRVGAGATFADVAKLTVYVVDWSEERMADLVTGAMRAAERLGFDPVRPITLIGVAALGEPDLLVEVEAVAVLE